MPFNIKNKHVMGNELRVDLEYKSGDGITDSVTCDLTGTKVTLKTISMIHRDIIVSDVLFINAEPVVKDKRYTVTFKSVALDLKLYIPARNKHTWTEVINGNELETNYIIDVLITEEETPTSAFAALFNDNDLSDFELSTPKLLDTEKAGSVRVHKAVLAACSPVFRRMFSNQWKETSQGHMELPVDLPALVAFKEYIYTGKLTEDLELLKQLHLMSSFYMMPELEQYSIDGLVRQVSAENAYNMLQFAFNNHCRALALAVLECFNKNKVNVKDIKYGVVKINSGRG